MNFNFSKGPEYQLNVTLTNELINLYGISTKFLVTEKINKDDLVFGDYTHLKTNSSSIFNVNVMPENSESYDSQGINFSSFGMINLDTINLFISRASIETIFGNNIDGTNGFNGIIGNLIVLPNNKIVEITDVEFMVPGINNLYTNNDVKSVYKLFCKAYNNKLIQELDHVDISIDPSVPYETLDNYFQELIDINQNIVTSTEVTPSVNVVQTDSSGNQTEVLKPIIDKSEEDVFGAFS
jgi:hypothetical protein